MVNISTVESFVRGNVVDQSSVSLAEGPEGNGIVAHIAAVVTDRINFEMFTKSLICMSQSVVGTGWSAIYACADVTLGYVCNVYILSVLFVSRAVLASLFTALFYVHVTVLINKEL